MKYNVLVVDDEPLIARSVSRIIEKTNSSFKVSGVCYNGKEALEHICKETPDIVFTDVQMPVMDGLELAHELHIHYPSIHIIILSGYNEFKYAQTAIREGVRDYLLKPLNREKVAELLTILEKELEISSQSIQLELWNQMLYYSDISVSKEYIHKYLPCESYLLMLTCCGPYFHSASTPSEELCSYWKSNYIFENCWELLPDIPFWIIDYGHPNEKLIIISCENSAEFPALNRISAELHSRFCEIPYPVTSIAAQFDIHSSSFSDKAVKMGQFLRQRLLFGESSFHFLDSSENKVNTAKLSSYFSESQKKLIPLLFTEKQKQKLFDNISQILDSFCSDGCTQVLLETFMKNIILLILTEIKMDDSVFLYYDSIYDITATTFHQDELKASFFEILEELFQLQEAVNYNNMPQNIIAQNVHTYIESHYAEPINIQTLATRFSIVAPYLSKLYFDYYNISPKKEILQIRIKKAEELLKIVPPIPLRQIAEQVGFNDQFYFSKVFKQQHSISPVEFRKLVNAEPFTDTSKNNIS